MSRLPRPNLSALTVLWLALVAAQPLLAQAPMQAPPSVIQPNYAQAQNNPVLVPVDPGMVRESLKTAVAQVLAEEHVPSAALVLVDQDQLVLTEGFGTDGDEPVTAASLFRLGNPSELVVALVALRLAERGVVGLEQTVHELLPNVPVTNPFEATHPLRLAHLLEHTSGLEELLPHESVSVPAVAPLESIASLVALRPRAVRWEPGTRFSFSSANSTLAALVLETAAKTPFAELARREVFAPLGLLGTSYLLDEAQQGKAHGAHRGVAVADALPRHWAARGLASGARDLGLLLRAITARGKPGAEQFLTLKSIERLERGRTLPTADRLYGPGLASLATFDDAFWGQGRRGDTAGTLSEVRWYPREGRGYVLLLGDGEAQEARARIGQLVRMYLLGNARAPNPPARVDVPPASLATRVGYWTRVSAEDRLIEPLERLLGNAEVTLDQRPDGQADLRLRISFGNPLRLLPLGGDVFRVDGEQQPTVAFETPATGPARMVLRGALWEQRTLAQSLWMRVRLALTILALVALVSALLFALIWIPRALFGALRTAPDLRLRALPVLAAAALVLLWLVMFVSTQPLGVFNLTSALVWLLPLLWAALSLASLLLSLRLVPQRGGPARRLVWMHTFFIAVLSCGLAGWLAWNGLLGLRLWAL